MGLSRIGRSRRSPQAGAGHFRMAGTGLPGRRGAGLLFHPIRPMPLRAGRGGIDHVGENRGLESRVPRIPAEEAAMMPPTTTPSVGEARRQQEGHGYGLDRKSTRLNSSHL